MYLGDKRDRRAWIGWLALLALFTAFCAEAAARSAPWYGGAPRGFGDLAALGLGAAVCSLGFANLARGAGRAPDAGLRRLLAVAAAVLTLAWVSALAVAVPASLFPAA